MSLLMKPKTTAISDHIVKDYLEYMEGKLAFNSLRNRKVQLKFLSKFCFEKLSQWQPSNMYLVDLDVIIREILYDIPKDQWSEKVLPILQEYIWWRGKNGLNPYSNKLTFNHITEFLFWTGIKLDPRDIKALNFPKIEKKAKYSLVMQEIQSILAASRADRKALYLALLSSGMRISEAMAVLKRDISEIDGYWMITLRAETTKTKTERRVFLSKEARAASQGVYDVVGPNDRIFMNTRAQCYGREDNAFLRLIRRLAIGTEEKHPTLHRFRAFFYKKASKAVDTDFGHQMLGHSGQLMTYAEVTDEELLELYQKTEPELTVEGYFSRQLKEITLEARIAELEARNEALSETQPSS